MSDRLANLHSYLAVVSFSPAAELELAYWQQGQNWRQEWSLVKENPILLGAAVGQKDGLLAAYPGREAVSLPLFQLWLRPDGDSGWQKLGLDLEQKGYAFQGDLPCQVVGGSEEDSAQLWLDVQKNLPRRLILPSGLQLDWLQYKNVGNFPLPHQVRIQSKSFHLEGEIVWRAVNTPLPQHLFLQDSLPEASGITKSSHAASQLLQELQRALPRVD
ncbi:MAG: hypothetical protein ACQEQX_09795 [Thermodesulfobacteriota bacterium]